jgi:hypothetical protein
MFPDPTTNCDDPEWRVRHFTCFARNGVWGTCGDCPCVWGRVPYPEFCVNRDRSDHLLGVRELVEQYGRRGGGVPC